MLVAADRRRDAIRVLSEWAAANPTFVVAELRRLGAAADADEVLALARRSR